MYVQNNAQNIGVQEPQKCTVECTKLRIRIQT